MQNSCFAKKPQQVDGQISKQPINWMDTPKIHTSTNAWGKNRKPKEFPGIKTLKPGMNIAVSHTYLPMLDFEKFVKKGRKT